MGKRKSQWEFGELFEEKDLKKTYAVSELTSEIRKTLEGKFRRVRVAGEVSNFRAQSSGHCYFGLKDAGAQLSCVLFRGERVTHRGEIDNGISLVLEGDLSVYEPRGQYQLIVRSVELQGQGALQQAFERLKAKLEQEGLFAAERKRAIPPYVFRLGVVTSPTAAALRDVVQIVRRRHPSLQLVLNGVRVQGQGAAEEIAAGIARLNRYAQALPSAQGLDAILVTRGGGSLEDLWAFNEEPVARAIAASDLPVVSAVGHEIDFTIADFVADLRAPTPSAAAELLTEGVFASRDWVWGLDGQLGQWIRRAFQERAQRAQQVVHRLSLAHPQRSIEGYRQHLDDFEVRSQRMVAVRQERARRQWTELSGRLQAFQPTRLLSHERARVTELGQWARERVRGAIERHKTRLDRLGTTLRLLSPLNVLERGYSLTRRAESGKLVTGPDGVAEGDALITLVKDGEIRSKVEGTSPSQAD